LIVLFDERDRRFASELASLRELITAYDHRYEQRFEAQQLALHDALTSQEKAVAAALNAADRAVITAQAANEKRVDATNEFRGTLADAQATLMPRTEAEARIQSVADKLSELATTSRDQDDRLREQHQRDLATTRDEFQKALQALGTVQTATSGRDRGISQSWMVLCGAVGLAVVLLDLGARLHLGT
jgi:Flp pilus assembly protein TadB